ncbi:MAG: excinuclease ABC subunit UvrC, partial [Candidatus Cloacimonadota bacterium]|nr:excinuclease ABC subunit UvrC [Candidatus Cloacimonadota bacterium]
MVKNLSKKINSKLVLLPYKPGIYKMLNKNGKIIYIGKAKILKNRVRSYFHSNHKDRKTRRLVKNIADIDYIITNTEDEALELEANAIRSHKPRYNILLKDDKSLPHIKITINEDFPKISYTRKVVDDGSKYFGPYTKSKPVWKTLKLIEWILPMRTCNKIIIANEQDDKPCLNYQMGKCPAPCANKISYNDYQQLVNNVIKFLQGKNQVVVDDLKSQMMNLSQNMKYEKAAKIRDQITNIENLHKQSNLYFFDKKDRDVLGIYKEENKAAVSVLKVLSGRLLNKEIYSLENVEDSTEEDMLKAFLMQYYSKSNKRELPHQILLQIEPSDVDLIQSVYKNKLKIPQRGEYMKLIKIAKKNAFFFVEEQKLKHLRKSNRTIFPVQELKEKLGLKKLPRKIYCFDVSTIQGTDTVSSMVYFENGKPKKKHYRHFKIKTVTGQDDFAS